MCVILYGRYFLLHLPAISRDLEKGEICTINFILKREREPLYISILRTIRIKIVLLIKTGAKTTLPKHIYQGIWWSAAVAIWCVLQFIAHNHLVPQGHDGTGQSYDDRSDWINDRFWLTVPLSFHHDLKNLRH